MFLSLKMFKIVLITVMLLHSTYILSDTVKLNRTVTKNPLWPLGNSHGRPFSATEFPQVLPALDSM